MQPMKAFQLPSTQISLWFDCDLVLSLVNNWKIQIFYLPIFTIDPVKIGKWLEWRWLMSEKKCHLIRYNWCYFSLFRFFGTCVCVFVCMFAAAATAAKLKQTDDSLRVARTHAYYYTYEHRHRVIRTHIHIYMRARVPSSNPDSWCSLFCVFHSPSFFHLALSL